MRSTDQAWTLGQLQQLLEHTRQVADLALQNERQVDDVIRNLERRFSETITRERSE